MNIPTPKISKKAITVLATLGVIGLVYAFYFFVYVANNEREYQDKAFRTLDKISHNIQEKHKNNQQSAVINYKTPDRLNLMYYRERNQLRKEYYDDYFKISAKIRGLKNEGKEKNLINDSIQQINKWQDSLKEIRKNYKIKLKNLEIDHNEKRNYYAVNQNLSPFKDGKLQSIDDLDTLYSKNDEILLYIVDTTKTSSIRIKDSIRTKVIEEEYKLYKTTLKEFMKPLFRKEVFDELLIIRGRDSMVIYQTFHNKIQLHAQDSLFYNKGGINSSKTNTIWVQETPYKVFAYNLSFYNDEQWLLAGCMKEKTYQTETRSISFWIIIHSSLLAILLLFGMPVLRLVYMNFIERLHRSTVLLSGFSIIMGASLVVLFFLIESNYRFDKAKTDQKLERLSEEVKSKLRNELTLIYDQLSAYDSLLSRNLDSIKEFIEFPNFSDVSNNPNPMVSPRIYKRFNEVFWMNSTGYQELQFSNSKEVNEFIPLKDRDYFKHVKEDNLWRPRTNGKLLFNDPIYIESIVSWSSGEHEIAVSKKGKATDTNKYAVAAITSKFKSVIDAILPMGYGFSIITPDGEVLIHSDSNKNLQENFIEESKNNALLRSAIYSKIELKATIDYLGRKHRAKIIPLEGMPLFLVVYNDLDHMTTRVSEIWSTTLMFVFASFGVLGILLLIILAMRYKSSKLRTKRFFFNWMMPQYEAHKLNAYKKLIVSNVFVILLIIVFYYLDRNDVEGNIFKLYIIPTIVFSLIYDSLNHLGKNDQSKKKKLMFRSIVVSYIVAINLFYFLVIGAFENFQNNAYIILFQVLIILAFLPHDNLDNWIANFKHKHLKFEDVRSIYSIFLLTWLFASAITPVIYLYKTSYSIESKIWTKHSLLELSRNIEQQINDKNSVFTIDDLEKEMEGHNDSNNHGVYHEFFDTKFVNDDSTRIAAFNENIRSSFDSILFHLRPGYKNSITENRGLVYSSAADESFDWKQSKDSILLRNQLASNNSIAIRLAQPLDKITFSGVNASVLSVIMMLVLAAVFILGLYYLISFCVNKIYGLEFSNYIKTLGDDEKLIKTIVTAHNTILIGLPGAGKTALLKNYYEDKNGVLKNAYLINCITIGHKEDWDAKTETSKKKKFKTVILDNFEYKNDDHETNTRKLKFLEELLDLKKHIVIISEIEPIEILDMYTRARVKIKEEDSKNNYENELEIWRHTFSHFIEVYKPLEHNVITNKKYDSLKELEHGTFLKSIVPIIEHKLNQDKNMGDDDIILSIQQHAKSYYYAIWNALTNNEKFAVYDIANDGFLNTKNRPIIDALLKKGLLCYNDNKLRLMNESFTNFVLTVLTGEDLKKMDLEVRKKGKWVNIKLVIILVIVGLIILIGLGKPGFFKNINAILIAVAGVATVIPSLARGFSLAQKIK